MLYSELMTKETYRDLENYLETSEDAITLMGYNRTGALDGTKLIKRFQTTADPEFMGRVREFSSRDVMMGVPMYAEFGYSSFAVRDKSLTLRFPLTGSVGAITKYFSESEKTCPNFKIIVNEIERAYKVKVKDNERIAQPLIASGGTIRLAGRYNGEIVSEADKLVQIFNHIAKESLKDSFKKTTNPDRVQFIAELLTTMFIAESFDLGGNLNRKIDNALRLQLSNAIAALGNTNRETISLISAQAERAVAKFLKKSEKSPSDIISTLTKMGYAYAKQPTSLYDVLFGQRKNYMFNLELPQSVADKILGKTVYVGPNAEPGPQQPAQKYERKRPIQIEERSRFAEQPEGREIFEENASPRQLPQPERAPEPKPRPKTSSDPRFNFADQMIDELEGGGKTHQDPPAVIHLPGKVEEKVDEPVEPSLPEQSLEGYVISLLDPDADYIQHLKDKVKVKKPLFGGKTAEGVSERSLKNAFDRAVVKEIEKACKQIAAQFRKAKGVIKNVLSDIYNQLVHAKQFFGKGSERRDIKAVSGRITEAKKVKEGLVKPLEARRSEFVQETLAYQEALRGNTPTEDIIKKVKALSDTTKIQSMIDGYITEQQKGVIQEGATQELQN